MWRATWFNTWTEIIFDIYIYIIYIKDLCNVSSIIKFILFADDTTIFYSADSLELLSNTIGHELSKLHNWLGLILINLITWYLEKEGLLLILQ